jgi:hypothetical protein
MRPSRIEVNVANIPSELKERNIWMIWKWTWDSKEQKWTKPPTDAKTGLVGSSTNPEKWSSFEVAYDKYKNFNWDGIGCALNDEYCGFDFDNKRNPITGNIEQKTWREIQALNSYTEVSPSGKGVKLLCKANLPRGGHHKNGIGVFTQGRYFCITGGLIHGVSGKIESRQEQVDIFARKHFPEDFEEKEKPQAQPQSTIEDNELIKKILNAKNGEKFKTLWQGDHNGYPSQSEADSALCTILAFWTKKDAFQVDHLFRQSGLMREKWNEKHAGDGRTYGQMTIEKALELTTEVYEPIKQGNRNQNLLNDFRLWIESAYGVFSIEQIYRELGVSRPEDKNVIRVNLKREVEKGTIEKGLSMGLYQKIDLEAKKIDILEAMPSPLSIKLPGEIERLINIYPQSIICNVGSPNAGKTAFNLNAAYLNRDAFEVVYFLSEMGEELKVRLQKFDHSYSLKEWNKIDFMQRTNNFHQVIRPNSCNIIDYLETMEGKFYAVGDDIRRIYEKLNKGIAIVSLQMNPRGELAWGGAKTLDKARLYFTLDGGRFKIVKAKNVIGNRSIDGLSRPFQLIQGCKFKWGEWENFKDGQ